MKCQCPKCGHNYSHLYPDELEPLPEVLYIQVRRKKIGFSGRLGRDQLRRWASGSNEPVFTSLDGILEYCHLVDEDMIYECRRLGSREELQNRKEVSEGEGEKSDGSP
jgi:hypothetical protein